MVTFEEIAARAKELAAKDGGLPLGEMDGAAWVYYMWEARSQIYTERGFNLEGVIS